MSYGYVTHHQIQHRKDIEAARRPVSEKIDAARGWVAEHLPDLAEEEMARAVGAALQMRHHHQPGSSAELAGLVRGRLAYLDQQRKEDPHVTDR